MRTTVCLCLNNGDLFTHLHTEECSHIRTLPHKSADSGLARHTFGELYLLSIRLPVHLLQTSCRLPRGWPVTTLARTELPSDTFQENQ